MRIRSVHLAGVILLLASLGVAEGSSLRDARYALASQYVSILLGQDHVAGSPNARLERRTCEALETGIPAAARAQFRATWTMRPPASQSVDLHAVTGSSL